jgi:hypothetical protein
MGLAVAAWIVAGLLGVLLTVAAFLRAGHGDETRDE